MRATVGPLPSAVYWRRRLVVLGAILLGVIVFFVSCSGEDEPDPKKTAAQYPTPAPADPSAATPTPSFEASAPGVGPALPDPADLLSQKPDDDETLPPPANASAPAGGGTDNGTGTGTGSTCADTELQLTPVPADTSPQRGTPTEIQIKIKNVGGRTCSRDLGSSAQELYIEQGAQKFWSSDQCTTSAENDVVSLAAGAEKLFKITWNGRSSTQCADNAPSGPSLSTGPYALRARLDTKISDPVVLTIVN